MELPEQDRQAFIEAARRRTQPQQGGAAFGVYPSSGKRPEKLNVSRDVNMPAQAARGWVAGTLGLPGDIESLGRMALNFSFGPGGVNVDETPVLPTSEFYQEYLPGRDDRPAAQFASGLGALAGGAGSTKVAGAAVKGAKATGKALGPKAAEMAESYLKKSGLAPELIAYHGTPHRFAPEEGAPLGKFRSEKIGTGEGAQAYGHGLYLAESPEVAKEYQRNLSSTGGAKNLANQFGNVDGAIAEAQKRIANYKEMIATGDSGIKDRAQRMLRISEKNLQDLQAMKAGLPENTGALYKVDLPDEKIARMLDWDKPLSQQSEAAQYVGRMVKRRLGDRIPEDLTGNQLHEALVSIKGGQAEAAQFLKESGIPGIRYLDRQSRPTNIMDKRLQGLFEKHNRDIEKTVNEYMRSIYDTPKVKEKIRADVMKQLEAPITRNFVIFPGEEESVKIIDRKAEGGLVEDTDAIAAKLTGMDKDKALTHALRMANAKQEAHMAAGGLAKLLKGAKAAKATEKAAEVAKPAAKVVSESEALQKSKQAGYPMAPKDRWYGEGTYDKSGGRLEMLSPDEFLRKVRPLEIDDVSRDNIDYLKRHIQSGGELDPLLITKSGKEDGRHRAYAAKELGITKVPVIRYDKELPAAPRAEALETARKNAVKMLGLPENNTAMDRAKALGFDADTYHGTFNRFENFDLSKANPRSQYMPGVFTADDPRLAENFGDYIMPLRQRQGTTVLERRAARLEGSPLPEVDTIHDKSKGIRVTNNPTNIRSRFAAFDPARVNENDLLGAADPALLAGTAVASGIGLGALGQMSKPKPEQEEKKKAAGGLAKRM